MSLKVNDLRIITESKCRLNFPSYSNQKPYSNTLCNQTLNGQWTEVWILYASILSVKEDDGLWSVSTAKHLICELTASTRHAGKFICFSKRQNQLRPCAHSE